MLVFHLTYGITNLRSVNRKSINRLDLIRFESVISFSLCAILTVYFLTTFEVESHGVNNYNSHLNCLAERCNKQSRNERAFAYPFN